MIYISCFNTKSIIKLKFKVKVIYHNISILEKESDNIGRLSFSLNNTGVYLVKVYFKNFYKDYIIYYKNKDIFINIYFNECLKRYVTFKLTDKNYQGLKIKGGKLILWENHIQ